MMATKAKITPSDGGCQYSLGAVADGGGAARAFTIIAVDVAARQE